LQQTFPPKLAFPYFRLLIAKQEVKRSDERLAAAGPSRPRDSAISTFPRNLIVNGGFEENLLNGGFDWWYESNPHAALAIDTDQFLRWNAISFRNLRWTKRPRCWNRSVHPGQAGH